MKLQDRQAGRDNSNTSDFFRINQTLESAGDIFEINAGTKSICVGADSDVADLEATYRDLQMEPNQINQVGISVGNPFAYRLIADNTGTYANTGSKARILVNVRDVIDNSYVPKTFAPVTDRISRQRPIVDLIGSLAPTSIIAPTRNDKIFRARLDVGVGANLWLIVPFYGRKRAVVRGCNNTGTNADIEVFGVTLSRGDPDNSCEEVLFGGAFVVPAGTSVSKVYKSSELGQFDLLAAKITQPTTDPNQFLIQVSDKEG